MALLCGGRAGLHSEVLWQGRVLLRCGGRARHYSVGSLHCGGLPALEASLDRPQVKSLDPSCFIWSVVGMPSSRLCSAEVDAACALWLTNTCKTPELQLIHCNFLVKVNNHNHSSHTKHVLNFDPNNNPHLTCHPYAHLGAIHVWGAWTHCMKQYFIFHSNRIIPHRWQCINCTQPTKSIQISAITSHLAPKLATPPPSSFFPASQNAHVSGYCSFGQCAGCGFHLC